MSMSERVRTIMTLPIGLLITSTVWAQESELLADRPAAEAAGFQIIDMRPRPSEEYSPLVRQLIAEYARGLGVDRPVRSDWASIRLPGGQVLLAVWPLGVEFDVPGADGGRLLVYAVRNDTAAELVLDTTSIAVGVRGGEIAAVDETGFKRFVWDGAKLQRKP